MGPDDISTRIVITLYAFRWVPPFVRGFVRDVRVRWALEEAGLPYEQRLIGRDDQASKTYRALQPFGQVPAIEDDGLRLFESGAIVLHVAERSEALMPRDAHGRARTIAWMFAALNSIEPHVQMLGELDFFHAKEEWAKARRPELVSMVGGRLAALADALAEKEYLEGRFTAADILMTHVLKLVEDRELLERVPSLVAYRQRCEARPAFQKAMADHLAAFEAADASRAKERDAESSAE